MRRSCRFAVLVCVCQLESDSSLALRPVRGQTRVVPGPAETRKIIPLEECPLSSEQQRHRLWTLMETGKAEQREENTA
ncbi:uncharacterized [Tachysurus ichikawai]